MRDFDKEGLSLATIQGNIFEKSVEKYDTSSPVFVRRFMKSRLAKEMDSPGFMEKPFNEEDSFERLDKEYGHSNYGISKIDPEIMFWMGYIYRYWAYVYEMSSKRIYRIIKPKEMEMIYPGYHTLDPLAAIQRIMEAKGVNPMQQYSVEEGVKLMKAIREAPEEYKAKSGKL